ncbi:MAG: hypothetical protein A2Z50_00420 [Nitrospirae bacterium RBG_19FT_COMBO_42_15]|nr:MAG: hypothetical protein A2Z50_00420 [Nitrospirae bacterium RBG_19FT_COMBO_42_15]
MFKINIFLASIGLVLATASFLSGMQLIKKDNTAVILKIHRLNGYITFLIFISLALMPLFGKGGIKPWAITAWGAGFGISLFKIWAVKAKKGYKYGTRLGIILFIIWLAIIYTHVVK